MPVKLIIWKMRETTGLYSDDFIMAGRELFQGYLCVRNGTIASIFVKTSQIVSKLSNINKWKDLNVSVRIYLLLFLVNFIHYSVFLNAL